MVRYPPSDSCEKLKDGLTALNYLEVSDREEIADVEEVSNNRTNTNCHFAFWILCLTVLQNFWQKGFYLSYSLAFFIKSSINPARHFKLWIIKWDTHTRETKTARLCFVSTLFLLNKVWKLFLGEGDTGVSRSASSAAGSWCSCSWSVWRGRCESDSSKQFCQPHRSCWWGGGS